MPSSSPFRFDLETALAAWRRSLTHNRAFTAEDLDELERHVRDQVAALVARGQPEEAAFRQALQELGTYGAVEDEYRKVVWGKRWRQGQVMEDLRWRGAMLKNYLTVALRTLRRQKGYTAINVAGLTAGLTCCILIGLFVRFELSYDTFHEKADRIVRVAKEDPGGFYLGTNRYALTPAPLVGALTDEVPEVEHAVQVAPVEVVLEREASRFYENGLFATRSFFDVFSFELLRGDAPTVLAEPGSVVLTASLARTYFGDADPMGQTLSGTFAGAEGTATVTGIVADPPPNSHLAFDFLLAMMTFEEYRRMLAEDAWDSSNYYTYAALRDGADRAAFDDKLAALAQKYLGQRAYYRENPDRISRYFTQALTDIHLRSRVNFEIGPGGNLTYVLLFGAIGLVILLIACINYLNLSTARAVVRAKEVGVRKVVGARRSQLIGQFMGEALLLAVAALALAVVAAHLLLPLVGALAERTAIAAWTAPPSFWLAAVGAGLGVGLLAGSYPAFVLSGFAPLGMMQGLRRRRTGAATLRRGLVVLQFGVTTALVAGALVIYQQVRYAQTAHTGLDRTHIVSIPIEDRQARAQYPTLKQVLAEHSGVLGVTASRFNPTRMAAQSGLQAWEGAEAGAQMAVYHSPVQRGFVDLFGIELIEGRDFAEERLTDEAAGALINEAMARRLGWDSAVGKHFTTNGREMRVVGVMKDFHFLSFRQEIAPLTLYLDNTWFNRVLVKVRPEQTPEALAHLEATVQAFAPAYPFTYEFLDDAYDRMYRSEQRLGMLIGVFTGLALGLACLGLLGLAAFMAARRTKEIGIRKALGASLADILALLSADFLRLVLVAFVLGAPLAYLALQRWLDDFAYRIDLGPGLFLLTGAVLLVAALGTVSYQAVRAARANPVQSLQYE